MALNDLITQIDVAARLPTKRSISRGYEQPKPQPLDSDYRQKLARSLDETSRRNGKVDNARPQPTDSASNRSTSTVDQDTRSQPDQHFDRPSPAEKTPETKTDSGVKAQELSHSTETADKVNGDAATTDNSETGAAEDIGNDKNNTNPVISIPVPVENDSTNGVHPSEVHIVTDDDLDIVTTHSGGLDKTFLFEIQIDEAAASKSDPEQLTSLADDAAAFVSTEAPTLDIPLGLQLLLEDIFEQAESETDSSVGEDNNDEPLVPPFGLLQVLDTGLHAVDARPNVVFSVQTKSEHPADGQRAEASNIEFETFTFSRATGMAGDSTTAETPELKTSDDANRSIQSQTFDNLPLDVTPRPDGVDRAQPIPLPSEAAASHAPSPLPLPTDHGNARFAVPESVADGPSPANGEHEPQAAPAEVSAETIQTAPPSFDPNAVPTPYGMLTTESEGGALAPTRVASSSGDTSELSTGDTATTTEGVEASRQSRHETGLGKSINSLRPEIDPAEFADRLAGAIRQTHQAGRQLRMRLHPPELGVIQIEVTVKNGVLSARLEVQTPAAQQAILENLSSLRDAISHHGTIIDRVDVELGKNWSEDAETNFGSEDSREQDPEEQEQNQKRQETETQIDEDPREQTQPRPARMNLDKLDIQV